MRPLGVVVVDPAGQDCAGLADREEQCLVEQLVAHATIEALDEPVLRRFAGRDLIKHDKSRYWGRYRIEIMFGRLKDWCRAAIRYDRCPTVFMAAVLLAATVILWL